MQTLERATALLAGAGSIQSAGGILHALGFRGPALPLDSNALNALGLQHGIRASSVAQGLGALRALAIEIEDDADLRATLDDVARSLARHSPQLLWIVIAIRTRGPELAILCWSADRSRTRVVSLLCNPQRLFASDAETLCALSAALCDSDLLTHSRWLDILGREAITRRFFRALEAVVGEMADSLDARVSRTDRRGLALLYSSRLIFLSFLETKGWLNGDFGFLSNGYSRCMSAGGHYQRRVLEPLFFGTLNTRVSARSARARGFGRIPFLNGGLFARSPLEKRNRCRTFTDESFGNAYGSLLSRYRFSGREDSTAWSESSIDPEMLGKAFEALMAAQDRKSSGAFFTPQPLVEQVAERALIAAVVETPGFATELTSLSTLRVLDPACGSGAFLVHMLERIAKMRVELGEPGSVAEIRRRVLASSIFGVDLNPMAVWLCELRLWLSIVIESSDADPMHVVPLPNLDRNIRMGDSLAGGAFGEDPRLASGRKLFALRNRYIRASGPRKRTLARALDREERNAAIEVLSRQRMRMRAERREILLSARARDLFGTRHPPERGTANLLSDLRAQMRSAASRERQLRAGAALPFSFAAHFSDVAAAGGFDVVVGNPPWVRLHHIAQSSRAGLRSEFAVYRGAAWESGAAAAGAGRGFAAQIDMSALFVERSCGLLRPGGTMALLLPSKLWRSLAGGGVRKLLLDRMDLVGLEDLADTHSGFDAAVYPSLLVCRRKDAGPSRIDGVPPEAKPVAAAVRLPERVVEWRCAARALAFDDTPGSPWLLIPEPVRDSFDRITRAGIPFAGSAFGRPLLGVKTGCNSAYVVRVNGFEDDTAAITSKDRDGAIERDMLRPLVRGETLSAWSLTGPGEYLVWPHDDERRPLLSLKPLARRWLLPARERLMLRSDLHRGTPWWSIFRTESASSEGPRVIWADFGLRPRAMVVQAGNSIVALNSCYVAKCTTIGDAWALAALLNGPLLAAWLNVLAEPARGGYRRYLGWTMSLIPLPSDWRGARAKLGLLGQRAMAGDIPSELELLESALDAYQLKLGDVQPLLSWMQGCY